MEFFSEISEENFCLNLQNDWIHLDVGPDSFARKWT